MDIDKQKRKGFLLWLLIILSLIIVMALFYSRFEPLWKMVRNPVAQQAFINWIDSVGPAGIPVLILFQILQVAIAFLPGGLVELASGMLYGILPGLLISLTGIFIGSILAGWLSNLLGKKVIRRFIPSKQFDRYVAFCKNGKFKSLILLFFFLPGIPKDLLIYAIGVSGTLTLRFGILITLIRIPSILVAVIAGDKFGDGEFAVSMIIYGCFLAVGLIGSIIHQIILNHMTTKE